MRRGNDKIEQLPIEIEERRRVKIAEKRRKGAAFTDSRVSIGSAGRYIAP